jgi:hypothetical protein
MAEPVQDEISGQRSEIHGFSSDDHQRVQDLTWALLDELITDNELATLNQLLIESASARATYIQCIQLHADLSGHFAPPMSTETAKGANKTPVLSFLSPGIIPLELQVPPAGGAAT